MRARFTQREFSEFLLSHMSPESVDVIIGSEEFEEYGSIIEWLLSLLSSHHFNESEFERFPFYEQIGPTFKIVSYSAGLFLTHDFQYDANSGECVLEVGGKFYLLKLNYYSTMGVTISGNITEVFPVEKTIIVYE